MSLPRLLITAGPTHEPIDPVRFIGNRSSGKLGIALAREAAQRGHLVTLLLGPVATPTDLPDGVRLVRFTTTADLQAALDEHFPGCDALVMAAAVADYRPDRAVTQKLPRSKDEPLTLTLSPTPDVVAGIAAQRRGGQRIVAFALESPDVLEQRARNKLQRKGVDAIVANPLDTMDSDHIHPTWIPATGPALAADPMSKTTFAAWLLDRLATLDTGAS